MLSKSSRTWVLDSDSDFWGVWVKSLDNRFVNLLDVGSSGWIDMVGAINYGLGCVLFGVTVNTFGTDVCLFLKVKLHLCPGVYEAMLSKSKTQMHV